MEHLTDDLIGPAEAAKILGKPRQTIARWCREGKLVAKRIGEKQWAISRESVMASKIKKDKGKTPE